MPRAIWNGIVLAEASDDRVEIVEGNIYFPPDAVRREHLRPSDTHTVCPWKGTASYYHVAADGQTNRDAAWYYPTPKDAAIQITGEHTNGRDLFRDEQLLLVVMHPRQRLSQVVAAEANEH